MYSLRRNLLKWPIFSKKNYESFSAEAWRECITMMKYIPFLSSCCKNSRSYCYKYSTLFYEVKLDFVNESCHSGCIYDGLSEKNNRDDGLSEKK